MATRRNFLGTMLGSVSAASITGAFSQFSSRALADGKPTIGGFGSLKPTTDATTGLPLVQLPEGFRYVSYGWTGQELDDGTPTPDSHDGMAVIQESGDTIHLCRNHEVGSPRPAGSRGGSGYDPFGAGGCTNLRFDRRLERFVGAKSSLDGTVKNCAGGVTPWNSWLSCEETVVDPDTELEDGEANTLTRPHGFVFDVPVDGTHAPKPIESLGRFVHEAVAIDARTGIVYLTEDRETAGIYRMIPNRPGDLHAGGRFQMLACEKSSDVRRDLPSGFSADVHWVDIEDRLCAHSPGTTDCLGVYSQGKQAGGLTFARLEGCAMHDGKLFVTATSGGNAAAGQVWQYDPASERLSLIFESPSNALLDMPDNMAISPRGGILLCEDGDYVPQRLQVLTDSGQLFPLAANNMILDDVHGFTGDYRSSEWAGATFSADGQWLFVNLQNPGVTFAITGPWQAGLI